MVCLNRLVESARQAKGSAIITRAVDSLRGALVAGGASERAITHQGRPQKSKTMVRRYIREAHQFAREHRQFPWACSSLAS